MTKEQLEKLTEYANMLDRFISDSDPFENEEEMTSAIGELYGLMCTANILGCTVRYDAEECKYKVYNS